MAFKFSGGSTEETRLLWKLSGLGFQFGTEIIAGMLLGWLVDRWFGTAPWGVVIGSIAGIAVAMLHLFRNAVQLNRELDASDARAKQDKQATLHDTHAGEEELTHERWKAERDRDLEPSEDRDGEGIAHNQQRGNEAGGRRHKG